MPLNRSNRAASAARSASGKLRRTHARASSGVRRSTSGSAARVAKTVKAATRSGALRGRFCDSGAKGWAKPAGVRGVSSCTDERQHRPTASLRGK
jgi:hypothetical protein